MHGDFNIDVILRCLDKFLDLSSMKESTSECCSNPSADRYSVSERTAYVWVAKSPNGVFRDTCREIDGCIPLARGQRAEFEIPIGISKRTLIWPPELEEPHPYLENLQSCFVLLDTIIESLAPM